MGKKRLERMKKKAVDRFRFVCEHIKLLTVLALLGIVLAGVCLRLNTVFLQGSLYAEYGRFFPRNDDSWWHFHWMKQVEQYGHRLNPDPETWAPEGRVVGLPPLFHYLIPYLGKLLAWIPLFDIAFYFPLLAGIAGITICFLLCRELYGTAGGLVGAFLYSTAVDLSGTTWVGNIRPSGLGEMLFVLGPAEPEEPLNDVLVLLADHRVLRQVMQG